MKKLYSLISSLLAFVIGALITEIGPQLKDFIIKIFIGPARSIKPLIGKLGIKAYPEQIAIFLAIIVFGALWLLFFKFSHKE